MTAPSAPYVSTVTELHEIVKVVRSVGAFTFDVETRGNIHHHSEVMALVEEEWQAKLATLKSNHPTTLKRSRDAIEQRWTEAVQLDPLRNEVFWIGIGTEGHSWAIPMGHANGEILVPEERGDGKSVPPEGYRMVLASGKESMARAKYFIPAVFTDPPKQLNTEQVFTVLEELFTDPDIIKINQNIKFDAKSVAKYLGGLPQGLYIDTMNLMHIIDENMLNYKLETILHHVFKFDPYWRDGKLGATIRFEPFSRACRYVHYDARWAWLAYKKLFRVISQVPTLLSALYRDIPVIRVLAQMEMNGILVNQREMKRLGKELARELNNKLADLAPYVWPGFNPDSTTDKAKFLFGKKADGGLGLKATRFTDGTKHLPPDQRKPSVDDEALTALAGKHPVVDMFLDYVELKKMKSTYVDGMVPLLHNGRLHPQFNIHRTSTGRLSGSEPNLQNIPREEKVRRLFIAEPENSFIVADYSAIEMRIMAMYSQDPELLRIFQENIDPHLGTARIILGRDPVDAEERTVYGKVPNFLLGYGGGPKRLVASTKGKLTLERAKEVESAYAKGYAGWTTWKQECLAKGRALGYVETMGGRRRRLPDLNHEMTTKEGWAKRMGAERQAINAVIQGTAAEICKDAMVTLDKILPYPKCKILLQVHDELVVSVPTDEVYTWEPEIERAMGNNRTIMGVPIHVEAHHAGSWAEAKGG